MRGLLVLLLACSGSPALQDAGLGATDAGLDAPAIGDPCAPDLMMIPTPCGSAGWCVSRGSGDPYTCRPRCTRPSGGCTGGLHQVFIEGGQCVCVP